MCIVAIPDRLASASVVFFGARGDVTRTALDRGVCRQRLYREAHSVLQDLDSESFQQQLACLRQQVTDLHACVQQLQAQSNPAIVCTPDLLARFVSTAQAEGVSLPVARRLLAVVLPRDAPAVATLGRLSHQAALRAGPLLKVLDEQARPRVRQACADEIFFGQKPVLMVVEPQSLCWLSGRLSPSRDGEQWAKELEPLPQLEHLVRDGGTGLQNGVAKVNQARRQQKHKPIREQLDHFHTLREGRRALRKTQSQAERAWSQAEEADKKVARQDRQGQALTGYATSAVLKWQKAEQAFHQWENAEGAFEQIRGALSPFTASGELNSSQKARQQVEPLLGQLPGEHWDKFKRQVQRQETYAYLDRLQETIEALPVSPEVKEAVVQSEGIRHNPELLQGEGVKAGAMRGVLVVLGVVIASAGEAGQQAVQKLRDALSCVGRASSCVEGLNSVVRMQQSRHRKMTQELLDLKRVYWNLRKFRTGRRKKTSPYERLGVVLPADLSWWRLLQLTPDQLRSLLSAQAGVE
jgi:hypothetical protein